MTPTPQLITSFYKAFQNKDYKAMQNCYAEDAVFNDEVFENLNAAEVKAMWEMFCKKGKDVEINFSNINVDEKYGTAEWVASYTFSKTNNKVVNHIKAKFTFRDGKISSHTDKFNFYKWARQALGTAGLLLGWTSYLKNKVRKEGLKNLKDFMKQNS